MKMIGLALAIILLNILQVAIRNTTGFYPDDILVSIIVGGAIGSICTIVYINLE